MSEFNRIQVSQLSGSAGYITLIQLLDRKIMETAQITELASEWDAVLSDPNRKNLLLNFSKVEFISSAALNKLINLNKRIKSAGGKLKITDLRPEIDEVFSITKLNKVFDIAPTQQEALASY